MAGGGGDFTFKFLFDLTQPVASARTALRQIAQEAQTTQNRLNQLAPGSGPGVEGKKPAKGTPERAEYDRTARVNASARAISTGEAAKDLRASNAILAQRIALTNELAQERLIRRRNATAIGVAYEQELSADSELRAAIATEARLRRSNAEKIRLAETTQRLGSNPFNVADPTRAARFAVGSGGVANEQAIDQTIGARLRVAQALEKAAQQEEQLRVINQELQGGLARYTADLAKGDAALKEVAAATKAAANRFYSSHEGTSLRAAEAELAVTLRERKVAEQRALQDVLRQVAPGQSKSRGETLQEQEAEIATEKNRSALQRKVKEQQLLLQDQELLQLKAQEKINQKKINEEIEARVAAESQATALAQTGGRGPTRFQNLLARIGSRQGQEPRDPLSQPTLGQFVGSKALTTAGFAVSGIALFGTLNTLRQMFEQTVRLQQQFSILQTQLESTDRAGQFGELRSGVLRVARETGEAADEVARLAVLLSGVFSDKPAKFINEQLEVSAKLSRLSTLTVEEITNSLSGLARTYGTTFRKIADEAAGLQARTGVAIKDTVEAVSFLAPAAKASGASFQEIAAVVAHIQQLSGKGGANIADSLARIIPSIQENAEGLIEILRQVPDNAVNVQKALSLIGEGKTFDVLTLLLKNFDQLAIKQQQAVVALLGGQREAQTLASLFTNSDKLTEQLARTRRNPNQYSGELDKQFKGLQQTVGQTFAQLKQAFLQLGQILESSGILQSLTTLLKLLNQILDVIDPLVSGFGQLSKATSIGGFNPLGTAVSALAIAKGVSLARGRLGGGSPLDAIPAGVVPISNANTGRLTRVIGGDFTSERTLAARGRAAGALLASRVKGGVTKYTTALTSAVANPRSLIAPNALSGMAAVATSFGGLLVTSIAATVVANTIEGFRKDSQELESNLIKQTEAEIRTQASSGVKVRPVTRARQLSTYDETYSTLDQAGFKAAGVDAPDVIVRRVSNQFRIDRATARLKALAAAGDSEDGLDGPEIKKQLDNLGKTASEATAKNAAKYERFLKKQTQAAKAAGVDVRKLLIEGRRKVSAEAFAVGSEEFSTQDLGALKALYDEGTITYNEYTQKLQERERASLDLVANTAGKAREGFLKKAVQAGAARKKADADFAKSLLDSRLDLRRAVGEEFGETDLNLIVSTLQNNPDLDLASSVDLVNQGLQGLGDVLKQRIDAASTAAEKLAIGQQGIAIPDALRFQILRTQIQQLQSRSQLGNEELLKIAAATGAEDSPQQIMDIVAQIVQDQDVTVQQALIQYLSGERAALQEQAAQLFAKLVFASRRRRKKLKEKLKELDESLKVLDEAIAGIANDQTLAEDNFYVPGRVTADASTNQANADQARRDAKAAELARLDYLKALAGRDALRQAEIDQQKADYEYATAENEAERWQALTARVQADQAFNDARLAIINAQVNLVKALVSRDPVRSAEQDLQLAQIALFVAQGEAERLQAQAQVVSAQQALNQAINDVINSQTEFAIAVANAAGNSVQAAVYGLKEAQDRLNQAKAAGAGQAELNQLQAGVITAQAALRDAQLQEQTSLIDFNLQTKKISTQQAIAQYEALLNNASLLGLTEQQTRDLILKIQSLKQSLSQDLQFNLPSELRLPTLYEARRLNQGGYQDNRIVQIQLNANNQFDMDAAVNQIIDAVNQPPVTGTGPRIY